MHLIHILVNRFLHPFCQYCTQAPIGGYYESMNEKIKRYLEKSGLQVSDVTTAPSFVQKAAETLQANYADSPKLLSYVVPKVSADGTCSLPDDLDPEPYDLRRTLLANGFDEKEALHFVSRMDALAELLHEHTDSDWTGIYKRLRTKNGDALVKLAYRGRPSRAEFPLTESFASHSNNATVGLTGRAVLVSSVREHREEGKPYYECDDDVQSELCVPIFSKTGDVSGIIDLESFKENHFDDGKISVAAVAAVALGAHL